MGNGFGRPVAHRIDNEIYAGLTILCICLSFYGFGFEQEAHRNDLNKKCGVGNHYILDNCFRGDNFSLIGRKHSRLSGITESSDIFGFGHTTQLMLCGHIVPTSTQNTTHHASWNCGYERQVVNFNLIGRGSLWCFRL